MSVNEFDLVVVGGGSGGVRAARIAAALGAKVCLIESAQIGGTCVHRGCIPKKLFAYAAEEGHAFSKLPQLGWSPCGALEFDFKVLATRVQTELRRLETVYEQVVAGPGATIVRGHARFVDDHHVVVSGQEIKGKNFLISVGAKPKALSLKSDRPVLYSDDVFHLETLPKRLAIVGAGYIGLEFASIFAGFGSDVTVVHRRDTILSEFDRETAAFLQGAMAARGVKFQMNSTITQVENGIARVKTSDGELHLEVDAVLAAVGRVPNLENLGLGQLSENVVEDGFVQVDSSFRTRIPHLFAVGDVRKGPELTPVALAEGMYVARLLFDQKSPELPRDSYVPTTVFSDPNYAIAGYTETKAAELFGALDIYSSSFRPLKATITGDTVRSFMKLIVKQSDQKVVGLHVVSADAGEIVQGFAVAMNMGATKRDFDQTLGIHPTAAEELVTMRTLTRQVRP